MAWQPPRLIFLSCCVPQSGRAWGAGLELEPFVITIDGPDGPGIIGAMSRILGRHGVNIENLKAILGEMSEGHALFIFEVLVPKTLPIWGVCGGSLFTKRKSST